MAKKAAKKKAEHYVPFAGLTKAMIEKNKRKSGIVASIQASQNCNGCWFWSMTAHNGETIAHSEAYSSKDACLETAKQLAAQLKVQIAYIQ